MVDVVGLGVCTARCKANAPRLDDCKPKGLPVATVTCKIK